MTMKTPSNVSFSSSSEKSDFLLSTRNSESLHTAMTGITNSAMEATASRKRRSSNAVKNKQLAELEIGRSTTTDKRRRLLPQPSLDSTRFGATAKLLTPPMTPPQKPVLHVLRLRVDIPQPKTSKEGERKVRIRRAAAERWVPKLQNPFPKNKEIKEAYQYKLMRHYTSEDVSAEPNFIKPHIHRSPRVDLLRERFPILSISSDVSKGITDARCDAKAIGYNKTKRNTADDQKNNELLCKNKRITRSAAAQKLAWEAFSSREKDRIDRGREAMMQSGLSNEALKNEAIGLPNGLPEWRKRKTGRFAKPVC